MKRESRWNGTEVLEEWGIVGRVPGQITWIKLWWKERGGALDLVFNELVQAAPQGAVAVGIQIIPLRF